MELFDSVLYVASNLLMSCFSVRLELFEKGIIDQIEISKTHFLGEEKIQKTILWYYCNLIDNTFEMNPNQKAIIFTQAIQIFQKMKDPKDSLQEAVWITFFTLNTKIDADKMLQLVISSKILPFIATTVETHYKVSQEFSTEIQIMLRIILQATEMGYFDFLPKPFAKVNF